MSYSFNVQQLGDEDLSESIQQSREVMIVPFSKFPQIVSEIQQLLMESPVWEETRQDFDQDEKSHG